MDSIIELKDIVLRLPDVQFSEKVSWTLKKGEHWAFIGPNGCGKTMLVDTIIGKYALRSGTREYPALDSDKVASTIKAMAFRDIFSMSTDYENSCYQQRWNSQEAESSPLVKDKMSLSADKEYSDKLLKLFKVNELLENRLINLSSGELRKFLLVKTLMTKPKVLILDNPFIGLDAPSRELMKNALSVLSRLDSLQVIFVVSNPNDIPEFITHVLPIYNKELLDTISLDEFRKNKELQNKLFPNSIETEEEKEILFKKFNSEDFKHDSNSLKTETFRENSIVDLRNVHIKYGKRKILDQLNWNINTGEKWALLGPNGAGKSTLLSLICADNPQSYANDIRLFGYKRGCGESIWQIKKRIGYISPEMHSYYQKNLPCKDIVGSGLFDTVGLYKKCTEKQLEECDYWLKEFGIYHLREQSFLKVSSGEQRLCLLARMFVKEPTLLIMDEPLHGLDVSNKSRVKNIIKKYCEKRKVTLIYVTHYKKEIPELVSKHFILTKKE